MIDGVIVVNDVVLEIEQVDVALHRSAEPRWIVNRRNLQVHDHADRPAEPRSAERNKLLGDLLAPRGAHHPHRRPAAVAKQPLEMHRQRQLAAPCLQDLERVAALALRTQSRHGIEYRAARRPHHIRTRAGPARPGRAHACRAPTRSTHCPSDPFGRDAHPDLGLVHGVTRPGARAQRGTGRGARRARTTSRHSL